MKMQEALNVMEGNKGFRIQFERVESGLLISDFFPERGEALIKIELEAWTLARRFAKATFGEFVNIYVIDERFRPVKGYMKKKIINREVK